MTNIYHKLRNNNPESARILVREVLKNNSVSKTAKLLNISRHTVRRARDGSLKDYSKRPKYIPNKIPSDLEILIIKEAKRTNYRYRLLSKYIEKKYSIFISENTIKAVLKRNSVKIKKIKTKNRNRRPLYDYENLMPFTHFQIDTKHISDKSALPADVYNHVIRYNLPIYEWNAIDVKTKTRFTAYSHSLSATKGMVFMLIVVLWCRTHNVREKINIRVDNGAEFCSGSKRKLNDYNKFFSMLNTEITPIPAGAKHLQGIVENSHRKDDECFFSIHLERCMTDADFIYKAQQWQDTWNTARPNFGIGMNGMTPYEKLNSLNSLISSNIMKFPVLLLEHFVKIVSFPWYWLNSFLNLYIFSKGGQYVYTQEIFKHTLEESEILLKKWFFWATHSRILPIIRAAYVIKLHWEGILQWFKSKMTNGILEGLNSLIQAAKAKARGYRTNKNLIAIIYLIGGKFNYGLAT